MAVGLDMFLLVEFVQYGGVWEKKNPASGANRL